MMASRYATRTGPRNGIVRRTFHPGCRRAAAIMAAFAFGRSSSSTSSWLSSDPARIRVRQYPVTVKPGTELVEGPHVAETFPVRVENDYVVVEA